MGTTCAPPYASIFMAHFEEKFIYPLIRNATTLYLRYMDDKILIWTKSENELLTFFEKLNQQHPSIKFEMKHSKDKIEFLNTLIYKDKNNNIQTNLYKKPTDRQNYIHSKSAHPFSLKKSIAYSQALRLKRICSTTGEYEKHTENLKKQQIKKGYPETMVNEEIQKATNQDRTGLLNKEKTETGNHLTLCATYNKTLPKIKTILWKHWHILNVNPELKKVFENKPLLAIHKNKNLRQLIGGNTIEKNKKLLTTNKFTNGKCSPCFSNSRTLCCKQVIKGDHFKSNQTSRTFRIFQ